MMSDSLLDECIRVDMSYVRLFFGYVKLQHPLVGIPWESEVDLGAVAPEASVAAFLFTEESAVQSCSGYPLVN